MNNVLDDIFFTDSKDYELKGYSIDYNILFVVVVISIIINLSVLVFCTLNNLIGTIPYIVGLVSLAGISSGSIHLGMSIKKQRHE